MTTTMTTSVAKQRITRDLKSAEYALDEALLRQALASFATGARPDMANLILWRWGPDLPHRVEVHDPDGRLPRDPSSWS